MASLWFVEAFGREALTQAALLLGATERMVIGTGIANAWGRDGAAVEAAGRTLTEARSDRHLIAPRVASRPGRQGRADYSLPHSGQACPFRGRFMRLAARPSATVRSHGRPRA